jgi:signal transduction histidine kinase
VTPLRRFPDRLHDRRFWQVQLLTAIATLPHYVIEVSGYANPFETLHGLAITLYVIPLLYAALSFGWEGAILTALWGAALTSPSMWIWHRSELHWVTELGQMAVTLPIGVLVAWRVSLESQQRQRAEKTSARLSLLNDVGGILSHTLAVEQELPTVVHRLLSGLGVESAWIYLEPESGDASPATIVETTSSPLGRHAAVARPLHERLVARPGSVAIDGRVIAVPLSGDTGILGSLGVNAARDDLVTDELVDFLTTVAHQVRVAIENARLYRQRQESLQMYVRQVTQAQEDERLRIARDLHDDTVQELVLLGRRLERLTQGADPVFAGQTEDALATVRSITRSVRRFSQDLRPSILDDLGLLAAIEMVVEQADKILPGGATLRISGQPRRIDPPVEVAVFRIAQEALRNIGKHARAQKATVDLRFDVHDVSVAVTDDGAGFSLPRNVSDLARLGKLGVLGMKERAELVSGAFEVHSEAGHGTTVVVRVPSRTE